MKIYRYAHDTGEFSGCDDARIAPLRENLPDTDVTKFLCPADATFIAPPKKIDGMVPVFQNGAWTQAIDHRGEEWFAGYGRPVVVTDIGVPVGLTETEPPAPPTITLTPQEKLAAVGLTVAELKALLA